MALESRYTFHLTDWCR